MGKPRVTSTGRVTFDDRGQSVWEWRGEDGQYDRDVDTARLRVLQDTIVLKVLEEGDPKQESAKAKGPYFEAGPKDDAAAGRRRSLDDMRRLSEEIKKKKREQSGQD